MDFNAIFKDVIGKWDNVLSLDSDDWNEKYDSDGADYINNFIDKHEEIFLGFGLWVRGLRIKFGDHSAKPNETTEGVLAIISLNVEIFRRKINQ